MFCPNCGHYNEDDSAFCENCGYSLKDVQFEQNASKSIQENGNNPVGFQPEKKSKKPLIITLIVIICAALVIAGLFLFIRKNPVNQKADSSQSSETASAKTKKAELKDYASIAKAAKDNKQGTLSFVSSDMSAYPDVKLYYSYQDDDGDPLILSSPTAGIKEKISNGSEIERKVKKIERLKGNQGLSIDIVADKSSSMTDDMDAMKKVMKQFVSSLDFKSGDRAEIISFDSYIMYMCTYTDDLTNLKNGISNMSPYGDTALYDALITGINNAGGRTGAKCVIAFTDGEDNQSTHTADEVISLAKKKEVPVYIIGTASSDFSTLENIAEETGGTFTTIDQISDMSDIMDQIYSNRKDLYCVEYESDQSADPYAARTVSCAVVDNKYGGESDEVSFTATKPITQASHSSRYEAVKKDISWTDANNECLKKGGHLVTITSKAEEDKVSQLAQSAGIKYCWIGGYTSVRNDQAYGHWITGEDFNQYTNWYAGEPSRNDLDGTPEFYLMLWNIKGQWSWNDQRDDVVNSGIKYFAGNVGYIIEYED